MLHSWRSLSFPQSVGCHRKENKYISFWGPVPEIRGTHRMRRYCWMWDMSAPTAFKITAVLNVVTLSSLLCDFSFDMISDDDEVGDKLLATTCKMCHEKQTTISCRWCGKAQPAVFLLVLLVLVVVAMEYTTNEASTDDTRKHHVPLKTKQRREQDLFPTWYTLCGYMYFVRWYYNHMLSRSVVEAVYARRQIMVTANISRYCASISFDVALFFRKFHRNHKYDSTNMFLVLKTTGQPAISIHGLLREFPRILIILLKIDCCWLSMFQGVTTIYIKRRMFYLKILAKINERFWERCKISEMCVLRSHFWDRSKWLNYIVPKKTIS